MGWNYNGIRRGNIVIEHGNLHLGNNSVSNVYLGNNLIWPIPTHSTTEVQYPWRISIDYSVIRPIQTSFTVNWTNGHSYTFTTGGSEEISAGWGTLVRNYYGDMQIGEPEWDLTYQWYYWPENNSVSSVKGSNGNTYGAHVNYRDTGNTGSMEVIREYTIEVY